MRFLLDANMPRRLAGQMRGMGHVVFDVRDLAMGGAPDGQIADQARRNALTLITRDFDFADVRNYPPEQYSGLIVLELPDDARAEFICAVVRDLLQATPVLALLPGRLAIVQPGRVRLRPKS